METPIEVLKVDELRVLRVIRIEGPDWNHFTGYIHYKRILTPEYSAATIDLLDELIFNALKNLYSNSSRYYNVNIFFKGEYEDYLKTIRGATTLEFTIRLSPEIRVANVWKLTGQRFTEYLPKFKCELYLDPDSDKN